MKMNRKNIYTHTHKKKESEQNNAKWYLSIMVEYVIVNERAVRGSTSYQIFSP